MLPTAGPLRLRRARSVRQPPERGRGSLPGPLRGLRRRNLLSDVPGLPKPSSVLEFLRARKERFLRSPPGADREEVFPEGSCPGGSLCQASRTRVEEFSLMEGARQVEVTEGCHCAPTPHECLRAPDPKTFFPDSRWSRRWTSGGAPARRALKPGSSASPPISTRSWSGVRTGTSRWRRRSAAGGGHPVTGSPTSSPTSRWWPTALRGRHGNASRKSTWGGA
ncbi:hypothetical protein JRQ81_008695 [Phrynocephalus forsythii]|uniref:Uncharacterized protein n=1 Tax=Phrynocephalus forsythii TaxID=171643 RepID=A0A9Q0XDX6_9SAUR|nr:hypothetical protein JRQ81_008695 [Phrynocephalus forsythii]